MHVVSGPDREGRGTGLSIHGTSLDGWRPFTGPSQRFLELVVVHCFQVTVSFAVHQSALIYTEVLIMLNRSIPYHRIHSDHWHQQESSTYQRICNAVMPISVAIPRSTSRSNVAAERVCSTLPRATREPGGRACRAAFVRYK